MPALVLDKPGDLATAVAEALQPGAAVVAALRSGHTALEAPTTKALETQFRILGKMAVASGTANGVVMESMTDVKRRINKIVSGMGIDIWMNKYIKPILERHHLELAGATAKVLNQHDLEVSVRGQLEKNIALRGGKRVGLLDVKAETKDAIFRAIEEGRKLGRSPKQTAKLFEDQVSSGRFTNAGPRYRAKLIARTETLHGQRLASLDLYRTSPVVQRVVAFDGDSDAACAARNGRVFSFDEAEVEAEEEHPNGTLAFGPVT